MFARLFAVASLVVLAVASPAPLALRDQCSTGPISCCNSVQQASVINSLLNEFGFLNVLAGVTGQVGLGCSPITVIGASGTSCTGQTACCNGDTFNGVIQADCTPINVNA
ncbi:Fungal hydrophobin domain containing protein [Tylopilus felleus]